MAINPNELTIESIKQNMVIDFRFHGLRFRLTQTDGDCVIASPQTGASLRFALVANGIHWIDKPRMPLKEAAEALYQRLTTLAAASVNVLAKTAPTTDEVC